MIKHVWWHYLKMYVGLGLHFYFKKIILKGMENIPRTGSVIFMANHQNALIDALLMATTQKRVIHSLTRGDIFKNNVVRWLLSTVNMVPIYRIRDGWQALSDNGWTFDYCTQVLAAGGCIFLFPEGSHSQHRRLRTLSKGFTRIIAETLKKKPGLKLRIIPVGINYTHPQDFGGNVSLYFGEPIPVENFSEEEFQSWSSKLRDDVFQPMKKLLTHIEPLERYDELLAKLEAQHPDYLDPEKTNSRLEKLKNEPATEIPRPSTPTRRSWLMLTPVFLFNSLPLLVWLKMEKRIKDPVFLSTAKLGLGISVFPVFILLQGLLAGWIFDNWLAGIGVISGSVLSLMLYKRLKWL